MAVLLTSDIAGFIADRANLLWIAQQHHDLAAHMGSGFRHLRATT